MDTIRLIESIKEIESEAEDNRYFGSDYFCDSYRPGYELPNPDGHAILNTTSRVCRVFPYRAMPDYKAYGKVTASDVEFISKMLRRIKGLKKGGYGHAASSVQEIEAIIGIPLPSIGDDAKVVEDVINKITWLIAEDATNIIDLNKTHFSSADPCCNSNVIVLCRGSSFTYRSWYK
jgi:hypothetical protein